MLSWGFQLKKYLLGIAVFAASCGPWPEAQITRNSAPTPYESVTPLIGSSGEGMTLPTVQLPFGMVQWGPDTHIGEWYNYAYEDKAAPSLFLKAREQGRWLLQGQDSETG